MIELLNLYFNPGMLKGSVFVIVEDVDESKETR